MALHPIKLPGTANELRRIVVLQRLLLRALRVPTMNGNLINEAWLMSVWRMQDQTWVRKFCRVRKYSVLDPIRAIADSTLAARSALYAEFCRQSRVDRVFTVGEQFKELTTLAGFSSALASEVHRLFVRFYQFLSRDSSINWHGYEFSDGCLINLESYKASCDAANRPDVSVCPYCDGTNDEPDLDHYYPKKSFPLLSCSPWNLVPACHLCNNLNAKGERLAMDLGVAQPTSNWLHPYLRPASRKTEIRLAGTPRNSIPGLYSDDPIELARLLNHALLIPTLSKRWTRAASVHFDNLVKEVNRKRAADPSTTIDNLVTVKRNDSFELRGREAFTLIHASVCQAVLDRRPEYLAEFCDSNPPVLI